jgi:hypothetical protein
MRSFTSFIVTRDYKIQYPDPIDVAAGAEVRVERADVEAPQWWWCVAADGRAGWVPANLLEPEPVAGGISSLRRDYSARELAVRRGDRLTIEEAYSGWLLVQAIDGRRGWVPRTHVDCGDTTFG